MSCNPWKINCKRFIFVVAALCVQLTACSVWETDSPNAEHVTSLGVRSVDETRTEDGQPYFLPKGLIHLVVTPQAAGAVTNNGGGPMAAVTPASATGTTTPLPPASLGHALEACYRPGVHRYFGDAGSDGRRER